jgi:hypothetical protein
MKSTKMVAMSAWLLALLVVVLAFIAWGQSFAWQFDAWSSYLLFPLFGLLAFSLMWTHYIAGAVRRLARVDKSAIQSELTVTGYAVLVLILLHPGLLIWQLWRDGKGLPPESYLHYVSPSLKGVALLGSISLLVFLAYELRPWFHDRKWWPWIPRAGNIAMLAIFIHGLRLGSQTQAGWYHFVWLFYGVTLVAALALIYYVDTKKET